MDDSDVSKKGMKGDAVGKRQWGVRKCGCCGAGLTHTMTVGRVIFLM